MSNDVYAAMQGKTLDVKDGTDLVKKVSDVVLLGDPNTFRLVSKASSEAQGWMKSTKAMQAGMGLLIQVTTQQRNPDGSYVIAEALQYVPNVKFGKPNPDGTATITGSYN